MMLGRIDFKQLAWVLQPAEGEIAAVTLNYGTFIQTCLDFVIVAFAIFLLIKAINSLKKQEEAAPPAPPADVQLLA